MWYFTNVYFSLVLFFRVLQVLLAFQGQRWVQILSLCVIKTSGKICVICYVFHWSTLFPTGKHGIKLPRTKRREGKQLVVLLLLLICQGCSLDPISSIMNYFNMLNYVYENRVNQVCQALLVLQDKLESNRDHLRLRFREGTRYWALEQSLNAVNILNLDLKTVALMFL